MEIVKKISVAKLFGKIDIVKLFADGVTECELYKVFGFAYAVERGESDYGPWLSLKGDFGAIIKGVEYRSSTLFAPGILNDMVVPKLEGNAKVSRVDFALSIGIKRDTTSATGYVYTVRTILAPNEDDPMERLKGQVMQALQLAAPQKAENLASASDAKPAKEKK